MSETDSISSLVLGNCFAGHCGIKPFHLESRRGGFPIVATTRRAGLESQLAIRRRGNWNTAGWWTLDPNKCEALLVGKLTTRYFYVHAVDYDRGGAWLGKAFMCTNHGGFVIQGTEDCSMRGHDRRGFFEVDTKDQSDWTIQLNKTSEFFYSRYSRTPDAVDDNT